MDQYSDKFGVLHKTGDIVIKNGEPYVYMNNHWESIDSNEDSNKEIVPSKCPNCGAPLKPEETKCSYCDSWFSVMKE